MAEACLSVVGDLVAFFVPEQGIIPSGPGSPSRAAAAMWLALARQDIGSVALAAPDGPPDEAFRELKRPVLCSAGLRMGPMPAIAIARCCGSFCAETPRWREVDSNSGCPVSGPSFSRTSRGTEGLRTRRWREMDPNPRSPAWESDDREVLRDLRSQSDVRAAATFPRSLSVAVDPSILPPERARNRAMSRRISWNKGVLEPEGRLAQVHPEDE